MESLKPEKVSETLTVYQKPGVFSYGTDAVMLARYVLKNVSGLNSKKNVRLMHRNRNSAAFAMRR